MAQLEDAWRYLAALGQVPVHRRVDEMHPLDFYVGLNADGSRTLLLVAETEPPLMQRRFKSFELTSHHRHDGRWAINVHLRQTEFARLFSHLCQDLVDSSREVCARADAAAYVTNRILRWERLLAKDKAGILDETALRGLVGEMVFLERYVLPALGPLAAILAWRGPFDAHQDFRFADRLVEVKSTGIGSLRVVVSSAEQLDVQGALLFLSAVTLESVQPGTEASFSVTELVGRLRSVCCSVADASIELEERLSLAGFVDRKEYDERVYIARGVRHFAVVEGFPRICRSLLPAQIGAMRYELDLGRCLEFEKTSWM